VEAVCSYLSLTLKSHCVWQASTVAFLALFTRFFNRNMRDDTTVTGVITLHGRVVTIGHVNSKIRGAKLGGFKRVVIPRRNYAEVVQELRDDPDIEILQASTAFELLNHCLIPEHSEFSFT
jgi:ATP-dependent Lon protease